MEHHDISVELILIIIPLLMIILEVFLSFNDIKGDTISGIIHRWAYGKNYFITLMWGIVTGHLFLGSKNPILENNTVSVIVVALLALAVAILGWRVKFSKNNYIFQAALLIVGLVLGHLLWSMNDYV